MRNFLKAVGLFACLTMLMSCGPDSPFSPTYKPSTIGGSGEILLVIDTQLWEGSLGDSLRAIFHRPVPFLTNRENMFGLIQIEKKDLDKTYKQYRNVLEVEVADKQDLQQPKLTMRKNENAIGQLSIYAGAKSLPELKALFSARSEDLVDQINEMELFRTQQYFERFGVEDIEQKVKEDFGIHMLIPVQARLRERNPGFLRALRNRGKKESGMYHPIKQGIMVYSFPYTGESVFELDYLIQKRDSVLKINAPGQEEGTYMATEKRFPPMTRKTELYGNFALEMRGLWVLENGFEGGPFVSVAQVDSTGRNVVVSEGYIYVPRFRNDEYLREVEACAKSAKIKLQ